MIFVGADPQSSKRKCILGLTRSTLQPPLRAFAKPDIINLCLPQNLIYLQIPKRPLLTMASDKNNLPQWYIDVTTPPSKPKSNNIPDPPGYPSSTKVQLSQVAASKHLHIDFPASVLLPSSPPASRLQPKKPTPSKSKKHGRWPSHQPSRCR